jgi:hypothetical protein
MQLYVKGRASQKATRERLGKMRRRYPMMKKGSSSAVYRTLSLMRLVSGRDFYLYLVMTAYNKECNLARTWARRVNHQ